LYQLNIISTNAYTNIGKRKCVILFAYFCFLQESVAKLFAK